MVYSLSARPGAVLAAGCGLAAAAAAAAGEGLVMVVLGWWWWWRGFCGGVVGSWVVVAAVAVAVAVVVWARRGGVPAWLTAAMWTPGMPCAMASSQYYDYCDYGQLDHHYDYG